MGNGTRWAGFATFAGYVVTYVWKEKTKRRAFIVGLALPYILWALLPMYKR
jgi:hypothetical protein